MNPVIAAIPTDMVPMIWPIVSDGVKAAIDHSNQELNEEIIYNRLCTGDMILLTISPENSTNILASVTLEKRVFDTGKEVLVITTAGGQDSESWLDELILAMDSIAKDHGCEELYIVGRSGWERKLKQRAFNKVHTVLSRKVV